MTAFQAVYAGSIPVSRSYKTSRAPARFLFWETGIEREGMVGGTSLDGKIGKTRYLTQTQVEYNGIMKT